LKEILKYVFCVLICFSQPVFAFAQTYTSTKYFEPEIQLGKILKTNSFFPHRSLQQRYRVNFGRIHNGDEKSWESFYSYPATGIGISYNILGNDTVFGNSYSALSYIELRPGRKIAKSFSFRIGLGMSYFDTPYDRLDNPLNKAIGSHLAFSFQLCGYYNAFTSEKLVLRIGGGYLHSSNGHTVLPNFGLNSGAVSISASFLQSHDDFSLTETPAKHIPDLTRRYTIGLRQGVGIHALGGTSGPVGGKMKPVYSTEVSTGIIFRQYIKLYTGFTARYYQHYYNYITENNIDDFYEQAHKNSTSAHAFLGVEFLMGHVAIDIQGGLTLYKPFYQTFDDVFQRSEKLDYWLKYLFPTRLGLKCYLNKTQFNPQNNFYIGTNISANFGEADFWEFCFGYSRLLK
jgi:hypothetical protein